jgi:protein-S-isoprenylcysteine O-methyltransferase Ste14
MKTTNNKKDTAGVIAPPPLIFLGGLMMGRGISWFYPIHFLPNVWWRSLGGVFVVIGIGIVLVARSKMAKAETNIEPWKPTTAILSDGIYGVSRNPVYVAMIVVYLGVVFLFNSLTILLPLILVLLVMHYGVILREERYLEEKFGKEYLSYKKKVRRWV